MLAPPPNGNVYDFVNLGQSNPDAWGVVIAWDWFSVLVTTALPGFIADMTDVNGVTI
jgi:hypothetical protein